MEWTHLWVFYIVYAVCCCVTKCLAMSSAELEDFSNFLRRTSQLDQNVKKGSYPEYDEDEDSISDHAWEESGKFEGDLILNDRQRRVIVEDVAEGLSRNGLRDTTKRWPDNEVIYFIQREHFSQDQVQAIENGIEDIARASCVKFRPYRKGDRDAVVIQGSRGGCFSQVGYQGGYQVLNLARRHPVGRGCFRHGTVVHEILHTLGFYHMQSSPDRDDYIDVAWENIRQSARHNFRKYNAFAVSDFGVGYDYDSVLHYSRKAFSTNGQDTLIPKQRGASIGQRVGLSDKDIQKLNKMYCDPEDLNDDDTGTRPAATATTITDDSKNKPFEGHGIGYDKGKTVVIKLPAAETYQLPDMPTFHIFDYFSKPPQTLPSPQVETIALGKEIAYSYKPRTPYNTEDYEKTFIVTPEAQDQINRQQLQPAVSDFDQETNLQQGIRKGPDVQTAADAEADKYDDDLSEAFDRLAKIIKTHVYPSQNPDLNVYRNIEFGTVENPATTSKQRNARLKGKPNGDNYFELVHPKPAVAFLKDLSDEALSQELVASDEVTTSNAKFNNEYKPYFPFSNEELTEEIKEFYRTPFKRKYINKDEKAVSPVYYSPQYFKQKNDYKNYYDAKSLPERTPKQHGYTLFGTSVPNK